MAQQPREKLRTPPEAPMLVLLDEISGRLADLNETQQKVLRHLEETTSQGIDVLVFEDTVSPPGETVNVVKKFPYHRLFKADVINKGANTVYVRVNEEKEVPVAADESIVFEKPKALIEYLLLRVEDETTVKILGHY